VADLVALLSVEYGLATKHATSPTGLRDRLALLVLATDLASSLGEETVAPFKDFPRPERPELAPRVQELARAWRNRRDLQRTYVERALQVERDLDLATAPLPRPSLARIGTFRGHEEQLQDAVEAALLTDATQDSLALAEARLQGFWASVVPELMDRWALVLAIGRVLVAADDVGRELARFPGKADAAAFAARYVSAEATARAWADLDMYHRQMERRYHVFDVDVTGVHRAIELLIAKARARYAAVASELGERFLRGLYASKLTIKGVPRQAETFERFVRPALDRGKTAYLLVDGLRYEMARELHSGIDREHDAELSFTLGTLPSITEVGMAALLPTAERGLELVAAAAGKLGVRLGDAVVRNRKERLDFLERHAGVSTHSTKLEALLPPSKKTREAITEAALVVVTATDELDGLCETGNVAMARRLMDDVLLQLWRGLRVLFDLGVRTAIVTADHGHLFGETLDVGATIDAPGGQTVDLHRRVWVGRGGASSESYLRMKAVEVGLGGVLALAVPWALAGFKAAGSSAAYFHGGASPQELFVPVWTVSRKGAAHAARSAIAWRLTLGSTAVSARFLSVQIDGSVAGLFGVEARLLRVEVRDAKSVLSRPVASSYGFEEATGFVQMKLEEVDDKTTVKPNTVTLFLEGAPGGGTVEIVARDVATDRVVAKLAEVPVKLAGF